MIAQSYKSNRSNLINIHTDADYIFIAGNGNLSRSGDTNYRFRQDSNVLYLSGLKYPGVCILINAKTLESFLVVPKVSKIEQIFDDQTNWQQACHSAELDGFITESQAISLMESAKNIIMNKPAPYLQLGLYANPNGARWYRRLRHLGLNISDALPSLAKLRSIKQPYEIKNMQSAVSLTKASINNVVGNMENFKTEKDIDNYITASFASQGLEHAYLPIIASASNAAVLHHQSSDDMIETNKGLLFDVGVEYQGYSADISRTIIVGNNPHLSKIIDEVKNIQSILISYIQPGLTWRQLQSKSVELVADVITKCKLGDKKDVKEMYPHAVGHFIGLDTHDLGDYSQPFAENMTITVEPGLYSKKDGFGVRI